MHSSDTHAVCRGCGLVLNGKPYYMGGHAYHPKTGERCPSNHYGGFVCSRQCDWKASVEQLDSMPGCMGAKRIGCPAEDARPTFACAWDSIYAKRPGYVWDANPLCWSYTFKRLENAA